VGDAGQLMSGAAWRDFCARLAAMGDVITGDDFPASPRDRAEGFRHLTRQVVFALSAYVELRDPAFPGFHAQRGMRNFNFYRVSIT